MKKVLALDFDGLIADGLNECILVTWNGYYQKDISDFSNDGLLAIPEAFKQDFSYCRNFARHLGHFIIPLVYPGTAIANQEQFDRLYQTLDPLLIDEFTGKVSQYRAIAREKLDIDWLSYHSLYPGMKQFLSAIKIPAYIVTAKDALSVIKILAHSQIDWDLSHIFGELKVKMGALQEITRKEAIEPANLYYFDDSISHAIAAQQAGFNAHWATWGYHAPEDWQIAASHQLPSLSLAEFLAQQEFFAYEISTNVRVYQHTST